MAGTIVEHIKKHNDSGRLALAIYLLHGYPTVETSKQAFEVLKKRDTLFECGLPITTFHTPLMSEAVQKAHQIAAETDLSDEELLSFYADYRPNMLLHMEDEKRRDVKRLLG